MDYFKESLKKHYQWRGKIEMNTRIKLDCMEDLALAYTPGVAQPCIEIKSDVSKSFDLTRRGNTVAVITDGTAVLGLGDIGPEAGMPVMEGKCALFKAFADIDAIPICLRTKDTDEIVRTIALLAGNFGGINLEDISAPRCFEIERRLKEICDIAVFHDDQHGTAIVVGAALLNALKLTKKNIATVRIVINGAGSAGIAIAGFLMELGAKDIIMVDRAGILTRNESYSNPAHNDIAKKTNIRCLSGLLEVAMAGADVFIGVSAGNIVSEGMIRSMAKDPIVFPLANPTPEISRELALAGGAAVVGSGLSNYPNQINNVLIFPGIFRGALDSRATQINTEMKKAACDALAGLIKDEELSPEYVIASPFNKDVVKSVSAAVREAAIRSGVGKAL